MPVLNSKTIYNEEIKVWKEQLDQDYLSVRAVQIPNGATFYSNIMIMNESPAITMTILTAIFFPTILAMSESFAISLPKSKISSRAPTSSCNAFAVSFECPE